MQTLFRCFLGVSRVLMATLLVWGIMAPLPGEGAEPVWGGPPQERAVALTFDDGPSGQYTPKILATFRRYHARATFFVLGEHAEAHPGIVRALVREGHELGNHSFSHPNLPRTDEVTRERELERTDLDLDLLGVPSSPRLFRPPYSAWDSRLLDYVAHTHRRLVLWGIDSGDWQGLSAPQITANVLSRVRPGAIIIFHDADEKGLADRNPTVTALQQIVPALQKAGYRLVTVSELLAPSSPPPEAARSTPAAIKAHHSAPREGSLAFIH